MKRIVTRPKYCSEIEDAASTGSVHMTIVGTYDYANELCSSARTAEKKFLRRMPYISVRPSLNGLDLNALNRRELQAVAKEHGVKANARSEELIEALSQKRQRGQELGAAKMVGFQGGEWVGCVPAASLTQASMQNAIDKLQHEFPNVERDFLQEMLEGCGGNVAEVSELMHETLDETEGHDEEAIVDLSDKAAMKAAIDKLLLTFVCQNRANVQEMLECCDGDLTECFKALQEEDQDGAKYWISRTGPIELAAGGERREAFLEALLCSRHDGYFPAGGIKAFNLDLTGSPADTDEVWNEVLEHLFEGACDILEELSIGTGLERLPSCLTNGDPYDSLGDMMWDRLRVVRLKAHSLRELPETLFDGCDKLTEIHVKARGIKALPERLFEECTSVTKVMLNNKRVRLSKPKP